MWIRSPLWDSVWILSGLPLGLVLVLFVAWSGVSAAIVSVYFIVFIQTSHSLSPIVLAWSYLGFRQTMLRRKAKYIGLPIVLLTLATAAGYVSSGLFPEIQFIDADTGKMAISSLFRPGVWKSPAEWLMVIYIVWNCYHFGVGARYKCHPARKVEMTPPLAADTTSATVDYSQTLHRD